jgi:hypothetical protein
MAGFEVPSDTSILVVEIKGVGRQHPLSAEKLSPVLSLYFVADFAAAVDGCEAILKFGGLGHTSVIHATDDARIREYGLRMPSFRVLVNTPSPQGSTGITTNVFPAIKSKMLAYVARKAEDAFEHADVPGTSGAIDRQTVVAAVERYLEKRGVKQPAPVVSSVVDRFLAAKRGGTAPVEPSPATQQPAAQQPKSPQSEAASEALQVADFVCEDDVRKAIMQSKKIFIGPKTIVTPSARDLALRSDTLVLTEQRNTSK